MKSKPVRLVGIHGFKGSGKDTVAKMIAERVREVEGYICPITHYADRLKKAAAALFDINPEWFYDEKRKETIVPGLCLPITPRKIMTDFHDGLVPLFGSDLFVHPVREDWRHWTGSGVFIVADVRYDGRETDWIRDNGGVIIHVVRPGVGGSTHSSEVGIAMHPHDYGILNAGSIEDLHKMVVELVATLRGHRLS